MTETSKIEHELAVRVIDTLLRENYAELWDRVSAGRESQVLTLPAGRDKGWLMVPLERDGFLSDFRVRRGPAGEVSCAALTLDDVDSALSAISDPHDNAGVAAFAAECRQTLAALRLRDRHLPQARARLASAGPGSWSGLRGMLGYEALAAAMPHPVYPTSECRLGFGDDDLLRYAPEFAPEFGLNWVAVPRSRLVTAGWHDRRPPGWPEPADVGLPAALAATHDLMPVHPATARSQLARALEEAGLSGHAPRAAAVIAPGTWLRVRPTLSTRTVAVADDPHTHIKLPLPTSTLGLLNRRSIQPGTLADGALVRGVLATAAADDEMLGGMLLANEGSYAHAGHPYLGYLLRRFPAGLDDCRIVSAAGLLAPGAHAATGHGRPLVIEELAGWAADGDLRGLFAAYLDALFDLHVRLFVRYGIALESHQQNTALVVDGSGQRGPRLLMKDFDGTLINLPRLIEALGVDAPEASAFADPRLMTRSDDALADVFITITVHLCAGAIAFGLAERGVAPLADLLGIVSRSLRAAIGRYEGHPAAAMLRSRVLEADRLPGKSMVTAGTLVAKSRTGAADINKFYGTNGPNYLKANDRSYE